MNPLKRRLIGALVGLARATDGNTHLITADSTETILECLRAEPDSEETLLALLARVDHAKRQMVPDCFHCANPCGRTASYDLSLIGEEPPEVQAAKHAILNELFSLAQIQPDADQTGKLYNGLVLIGMEGYSADEIRTLFQMDLP